MEMNLESPWIQNTKQFQETTWVMATSLAVVCLFSTAHSYGWSLHEAPWACLNSEMIGWNQGHVGRGGREKFYHSGDACWILTC